VKGRYRRGQADVSKGTAYCNSSAAQYRQAEQEHSGACDNCKKVLELDHKLYIRSARPLKILLPQRIDTRFGSQENERLRTREHEYDSRLVCQRGKL
jgi:hypothetical protein